MTNKANGLTQVGLHSCRWRLGERSAGRVPRILGGRYQAARPCQERAVLPAHCRRSKVRLDLAAAPGTWLMSSRMVINTERTVAYNSKLWQATPSLKLGLSNDVNKETKKRGSVPYGRRLFKKLTRQTAILPIKFIRRRTGRRPLQRLQSHDVNKVMLFVGAVILTGLLNWKR